MKNLLLPLFCASQLYGMDAVQEIGYVEKPIALVNKCPYAVIVHFDVIDSEYRVKDIATSWRWTIQPQTCTDAFFYILTDRASNQIGTVIMSISSDTIMPAKSTIEKVNVHTVNLKLVIHEDLHRYLHTYPY